MKRWLILLLVILLAIALSGCSTLNEESFIYYNGLDDESGEYFDEYAVVYELPSEHFMIIAVRSDAILDTFNEPYINYLVITDMRKGTSYSLSCGFPNLAGGVIGGYGSSTNLIPGVQIYDYCVDKTEMTLKFHYIEIETTIPIYSNDSNELQWHNVSDFNSNEIYAYMFYNSHWLIYIAIVIIIAVSLIFLYRFLFKLNYNQYTKKEHVRKLPDLSIISIIIIIIGIISISSIINNKDDLWFRYDTNFYDYEEFVTGLDYLIPFVNDDYTLIDGDDRQEIYVDIQSADEVAFYIVFVDGIDKYIYDFHTFDFPGAGEFDHCIVDLHDQEMDFGIVLNYVIECTVDTIDGPVTIINFAEGITEEIDGALSFVDFNDSLLIFENRRGFYTMAVLFAMNIDYQY